MRHDNVCRENNIAFKKNSNIIARKIHDSFFLIDISDKYLNDKCALYEINETGMFIWNTIDGTQTIEKLVTLLDAIIIDDVDYQVLYNDVAEFTDSLIAKHFVEV